MTNIRIRDGKVDLSFSKLREVPIHDIALLKPASLNLSGNPQLKLDHNFIKLIHIVQLDLSQSKLVTLPDNFGCLPFLKHLDLHYNKLKKLPISFSKLENLDWLNLKDNPLAPALREAAGPCENDQQCQDCAKNVVKFIAKAEEKLIKDLLEFEILLREKEMAEKAAGKKKQQQLKQQQQQQQQQQQNQKQPQNHLQQKQQQQNQKQQQNHFQQKQQQQQNQQQQKQQQQKNKKNKQPEKKKNQENGVKPNSVLENPKILIQKKKSKLYETSYHISNNNVNKSSKKKSGSQSRSFLRGFFIRLAYVSLFFGFIYIVDYDKFVRIRDVASYSVNKTVSLLPPEVVAKGKQAIELMQPAAEVTIQKANVLLKETSTFLNTNPLVKDHWNNIREIGSICSARLVDYIRTLYLQVTGYCNRITSMIL